MNKYTFNSQQEVSHTLVEHKLNYFVVVELGLALSSSNAITHCHTLISSGDLCLMTCDFFLVLVRCLAPIIRQFVKFQDVPENKRKY